jgi:Ni,Fe-hydrogenase III component G
MYQLLSIEKNSRIRLKTLCGGHEGDEGIPSSVGVFNAANWLEREVRVTAGPCVARPHHQLAMPPRA